MTDNERNQRRRGLGKRPKMIDRFGVRFSPTLAEKLRKAAKAENLRPGQLIRVIVTEALE